MSDASIPIQFDTDCIDEQLVKTAFKLNPKFSTLQNDFDQLIKYNKSFLLPLVAQRSFNNDVGQAEGCLVENSTANSQCYMGKLMEDNVMYPDMAKTDWLQRDFAAFITKLGNFTHPEIKGWHLHGSQPLDQDPDSVCASWPYTPRGGDLRSGLLCQHAWVTSWNTSLVAGHARYGHMVSQAFASLPEANYQFHEVWRYGGGQKAGHQGSKVGATWTGLASSLREVLVLGLMGEAMVAMPVCGTHTVTDLDTPDMDLGKLCLRWAQLAAFMPSMRSWYAEDDNIRMPYKLAKQYQEYISWSLEARYRLVPYMRSLQLDWVTSGLGLVRPMFVQYPAMWGHWDQFMLGPDLVIASVTEADQQLVEVSLPPGTWYDYYSGVQYYSPTQALQLSVPTKLYQLPVFIRGGSVLILYQASSEKRLLSIQDYVDNAQFEMKIALECNAKPRQLKTCEASSSLDWSLDVTANVGNVAARVEVSSVVDLRGDINITLTEDGFSAKTLEVVTITGLQLSPTSTFVLPGGVTASQDCQGDQPCWVVQQDVIILRNIHLALDKSLNIKWNN